jgi:hypothetical protein
MSVTWSRQELPICQIFMTVFFRRWLLLEFTLFGFISSVSTFGVPCCLFRQGESDFVWAATEPNSVTLKAQTAFIPKRRNKRTIRCTNVLYGVQMYYTVYKRTVRCTNVLYGVQTYYTVYKPTIRCTNLLYSVQTCYTVYKPKRPYTEELLINKSLSLYSSD